MFDDFSYRNYRVRAGVQHRGTERIGKWYGVISLVHESEQCVISLTDQPFNRPAAARRYAARYARALIDSRLESAFGQANELMPSAE